MPYVTEEIYSMLPIKEESIVISKYPTYNKDEVFTASELLIDAVIKDIVEIRNIKAINNITRQSLIKIKVNNDKILSVYKAGLKIKEEQLILDESENYQKYNYRSENIDITYFEEKNNVDEEMIRLEIDKIEQSINRRKQLLSNQNYINKAPQAIIEQDKNKLKEEEEKLNNLVSLLK